MGVNTITLNKMKKDFNFSKFFVEYGAIISLGALLLFNIVFTRNFVKTGTFMTIIKQATPILFTTIGMTFVISSGGTDISAGSMMAFAGEITAISLVSGDSFVFSVLKALLLCILIGVFNGVLISKVGVQPIILTLVMQIVMRGVTVILVKARVYPVNRYPEIKWLGLGQIFGSIPSQVLFFILASILGIFLVNKTVFGKYVEAIGESPKAARLSGIRTVAVIVTVYALSALFAGIGGILEMARNGAMDPNELGRLYEMDAIAGVAIGGTPMKGGKAKVWGSIMGCLLMIMIGTTVNMNGIPYSASNVIKAVIIIFSLIIQREASN